MQKKRAPTCSTSVSTYQPQRTGFGNKIKTTFAETVPEGTDAARVFRELAVQCNKPIFATILRYMSRCST
jgi:hypothetical protein